MGRLTLAPSFVPGSPPPSLVRPSFIPTRPRSSPPTFVTCGGGGCGDAASTRGGGGDAAGTSVLASFGRSKEEVVTVVDSESGVVSESVVARESVVTSERGDSWRQ